MKKYLFMALALVAGASLTPAEAGKKDKKKKDEPVVEVKVPVQLTNGSDSVSYAAGRAITNGLLPYLQSQGVDSTHMADFIAGFKEAIAAEKDPKMNARIKGMDIASQVMQRMLPGMKKDFTDTPDSIVDQLLFRGFTDAIEGDTTVMQQQAAEDFFKQKQQDNKVAKEEKLYGANREAGRKFLAENKTKEGVITTPSGLQYKVLVKGEGEVPQKTDKVKVHYEGRLVDGTVFDASTKHGTEPASFRADQVIAGWTEALTMMPVGSKWQLYIPYELAYGERNMGNIKPFSALIFDVELVGIDK
ncbi:MAG: FKBP-type peptidyl-prolyl cis-trans isomerase [Prevotella sp.]|nr:FKBP-type peptidyl-prolyl cis-trans isomerase [Prevotella sp.]